MPPEEFIRNEGITSFARVPNSLRDLGNPRQKSLALYQASGPVIALTIGHNHKIGRSYNAHDSHTNPVEQIEDAARGRFYEDPNHTEGFGQYATSPTLLVASFAWGLLRPRQETLALSTRGGECVEGPADLNELVAAGYLVSVRRGQGLSLYYINDDQNPGPSDFRLATRARPAGRIFIEKAKRIRQKRIRQGKNRTGIRQRK